MAAEGEASWALVWEQLKVLFGVYAEGLGASALYAGGPVVVEDTVVEEAAPSSSGWVLPLIVAVIGIAILTSKDDSQGQTW